MEGDSLSKSNEMIRLASQRGYTANKDGEILNPKGNKVRGSLRKSKNSFYYEY